MTLHYNSLKTINQKVSFKNGPKKQRFHLRGHINGKYVHEKILNISHQEMQTAPQQDVTTHLSGWL